MTAAYRAFISYSHADTAVADWLHVAIETYRVPPALVAEGLPKRLYPVFRDRSDMAAGGDLDAAIRAALLNSAALLVVCSPAAAASPYVDLEIRHFAAARPDRPILAVIVPGVPPGDPSACFPAALTAGGREPIAADLRAAGDGRRMTRLKLVAGLLGVDVVRLAQRDDQRRVRRLRQFVAAAVAGLAVLGVLLVQAVLARREAERQRAAAESLVEFMVGDLRQRLEPLGRLAILDAVGRRALDYYRGQDSAALPPASLAQRARVLRLIGEIQSQQGNLAVALANFRAAADSTALLLARDPDNSALIFDHAQNVFYIGNAAYQQRRLDVAQAAFDDYRDLAERLVALDPKRPEWQAELGYAYSNLGTLLLDRGRNTEAEAAFRRVLTVSLALARVNPGDRQAQIDLATSYGWLADALARRGGRGAALAARDAQAAIERQLARLAPDDLRLVYTLNNTELSRARVLADLGRQAEAVATARAALASVRRLTAVDPGNSEWADQLAAGLVVNAELAAAAGTDAVAAAALLGDFNTLLARTPRDVAATRLWTGHRADAELVRSALAGAAADDDAALAAARRAFALTTAEAATDTWPTRLSRNRSRLRIAQLLAKAGRGDEAARLAAAVTTEVRGLAADNIEFAEVLRDAERVPPPRS